MFQLFGQPRFCPPGSQLTTAQLYRTPLKAILPGARSVPHDGYDQMSSLVAKSDPRGRTKWYGVYTEEQYLAQRQSEERARWAASVRTITGNQSQVSWEGSLLDPPALLGGVTVVIMSPRKPVTVGTVARACGSFECEDLRIVMPRQESYITRHAKSASKGAQYILYRAGHYDSIEEATADCDVRIAFTRWAQASSPHVFKVDINGLTSHAAVQRVIRQPLLSRDAAAAAAAAAPRPPSAPWSEAAAAAAAAAEARLAAGIESTAPETASDDGSSAEDDEEGPRPRLQQPAEPGASGAASGVTDIPAGHTQAALPQRPHQGDGEPSRTSPQLAHDATGHSSSASAGSDRDRELPGAGPMGRPPRVALVFGREELGMSDEEVDSCEVCCSIPIGRLQESLSLSHAVSIALCALYQARLQHLAASNTEQGQQQPQQPQQQPQLQPTRQPQEARPASGEGASRLQYTVDASTGTVHTAPAAAGASMAM